MKAVLISIQPKWCEKIANGEKTIGKKTIEVRKSRPKLETPFKVYIYCTKEKSIYNMLLISDEKGFEKSAIFGDYRDHGFGWEIGNCKVIGEFVCDRIDEYTAEFVNDGDCYEDIRRHWIDDDGEEDFEIITCNGRDNPEDCELLKNSCLSYAELKKYIGENVHDIPFYAWHISNLKIYDKPKELSEFVRHCRKDEPCIMCANFYENGCGTRGMKSIKIPPQSWCYVEELSK